MDENLLNSTEIPMGLGMALAENLGAMQYFSSLGLRQQREIIARTQDIRSKQEMRQYVRDLSRMY